MVDRGMPAGMRPSEPEIMLPFHHGSHAPSPHDLPMQIFNQTQGLFRSEIATYGPVGRIAFSCAAAVVAAVIFSILVAAFLTWLVVVGLSAGASTISAYVGHHLGRGTRTQLGTLHNRVLGFPGR
jgi:hypothetical protein